MANLKEIRSRITSVSSTRQITSAMKMVSAAKLKRAQDAITQMKPYAEKLKELLQDLSSSNDDDNNSPYGVQRDVNNVLVVAITSNRGLAGAFNANIIKATNNLINNELSGKNITVLAIGKKADDFYKRTEYNIKGTTLPNKLNELYDDLSFENVSKVSEAIMRSFTYKQFDRVLVVYNEFVNAAVQNVKVEQFLPIVPAETEDTVSTKNTDYIFEPNKEMIVTELIPKSLKIQFYKAMLDSFASEHGARMTAMHKATDNAGTLIHDLKLVYNKARQAAITNEILEIVGGAAALDD
ncbi:ATP synthase F1 subunit gamma [Acidiluteibacter ferrifornacis]|jgi:F-type H+-transporting ATPase subunit gamma|uniref:ATP synthase gamma chain n=1 Tax=Acidiluteibacter ferrifornacis TaxID=2692424 RepID=A0A6N9NEK7_9FLAO|nr:ATP synthase F1 subunit gamma [Acidiluteibacter ferrifornacis]MBR9833564.1 ATP synthase F1 subunit gamma [bacterium]NBG65066.1 ATP synthase F1 subunit gamma [Acidiluteibacter ferrifornacis]